MTSRGRICPLVWHPARNTFFHTSETPLTEHSGNPSAGPIFLSRKPPLTERLFICALISCGKTPLLRPLRSQSMLQNWNSQNVSLWRRHDRRNNASRHPCLRKTYQGKLLYRRRRIRSQRPERLKVHSFCDHRGTPIPPAPRAQTHVRSSPRRKYYRFLFPAFKRKWRMRAEQSLCLSSVPA